MTYPPQQPGPYGQQPGPYGPPPQPGPYGHQQVGPYSSPSGYQGLGGYPGPGSALGGPGGEPPKKRNTGMIVTVAVVTVLMLAGAALAIFLLTKDDGSNTASGGQTTSAKPSTPAGGGDAEIVKVAQAYAEAVNARQESTAKELTCDKTGPGVLYQSTASGQEVQVTGKPKMSGSDTAFIDFGVSTSGTEPIDIPILLENNGGWCIAI
jgi:hypothetical protein